MNKLNNILKSLKVIIFLAKSHEEYIICEEAPKIQIVGKLWFISCTEIIATLSPEEVVLKTDLTGHSAQLVIHI